MKYGYSRLYKPVLAIALTTGALAACYQSVWKADYQSDVENGRNYALTSAVDAQGNLLVGGSSTVAITQDTGGNDIVHFQPTILKYAPNGTLLWEFHFDNEQRRTTASPATASNSEYQGGAEIQHLVTDTAGNIYAAGIVPGTNYSSDFQNYDVAVFSLDVNGSLLWSRVIEQPAQDSTLTLGLSQSQKLLLGVHHYDHLSAGNPASTSVLALNPNDGNIIWQHQHPASPVWGDPTLHAPHNALPINPARATTNDNRIAIAQRATDLADAIYVYDENGDLVWHHQPELEAAVATDVGIACSGDVWLFDRTTGLAFAGDDLIVSRSQTLYSCGISASWLSLDRRDVAGNLAWTTQIADPQNSNSDNQNQAYEDFVNGETSWFAPFFVHAQFSDAHLVTTHDHVYLATSAVSSYASPLIASYPHTHATVTSMVAAVSLGGESLWSKSLAKTPVIVRDAIGRESIDSTWVAIADLTLNSADQPVIALNEFSTQGAVYYADALKFTHLTKVTSRLMAFDSATGKQDSFGSEENYLARDVATNARKGVFKLGDNFHYRPGFKYYIPTNIPDAPAHMHISHYRAR